MVHNRICWGEERTSNSPFNGQASHGISVEDGTGHEGTQVPTPPYEKIRDGQNKEGVAVGHRWCRLERNGEHRKCSEIRGPTDCIKETSLLHLRRGVRIIRYFYVFFRLFHSAHQVLNLVMFGRWKFPGEKLFIENLRNLSVAIMNRPGAAQSKRYWGKDLPEFKDIAKAVHAKCLECLERVAVGSVPPEDRDHFQQCIIVGLQVLMPPMRGKPFYTLQDKDAETNSMLYLDVRLKNGAADLCRLCEHWGRPDEFDNTWPEDLSNNRKLPMPSTWLAERPSSGLDKAGTSRNERHTQPCLPEPEHAEALWPTRVF